MRGYMNHRENIFQQIWSKSKNKYFIQKFITLQVQKEYESLFNDLIQPDAQERKSLIGQCAGEP